MTQLDKLRILGTPITMVDVTILSTVSSLDFEQLVKNNNRQNVKNLVLEKCGENCLKLGSKLKKQLTCITLSKRNDK
ncbi:hypothetical protein T4D_14576 [Trichinella pseudospiralis]|uniref:Uncharacterized protein n=1 Tax=Trichinella pseudospiralis TaxID=6337 RepID=A0A0V1FUG2_TRIPS|nr:hypothetical protein T4D_14576 [Trichinella pseudospiralis]